MFGSFKVKMHDKLITVLLSRQVSQLERLAGKPELKVIKCCRVASFHVIWLILSYNGPDT